MKKYSSGAFSNEMTVAGSIDNVTKHSEKATKPTVCWSDNFNCYKQLLVVFEPQMIKESEMLSTDIQV